MYREREGATEREREIEREGLYKAIESRITTIYEDTQRRHTTNYEHIEDTKRSREHRE